MFKTGVVWVPASKVIPELGILTHTWKDSVHSAKVDLEPLVVESDYQSEAGVRNKVAKSPLAN